MLLHDLVWHDPASLPSTVRMCILDGLFCQHGTGDEEKWSRAELLSHAELCWVKQSWSWSTAIMQCEPEINMCYCKSLRFGDCLLPQQSWKYSHKKGFYPLRREFIVFSTFIPSLSKVNTEIFIWELLLQNPFK